MNEVRNVQKNKNRKKIAPWIAALVFIVLFGSYIGFLAFAWAWPPRGSSSAFTLLFWRL